MKDWKSRLSALKFAGKGQLCVALVVTDHARKLGLPLDPAKLLTERGGQVKGLGKDSVQAILNKYGITKVLAEEGGRTSRGSIDNMKAYVETLNGLSNDKLADLDAIEHYWIECVNAHFRTKPFRARLVHGETIKVVLDDLLKQARKRQAGAGGTQFVGPMLQHLVGAKLDITVPDPTRIHHGSAVADGVSDRQGDFLVGDCVIHVTTAPSEALMRKCEGNLKSGLHPMVITLDGQLQAAEQLSLNAGIYGEVEILGAERFLAANLYEQSGFSTDRRLDRLRQLFARYNEIVDQCESDPGLKIDGD